MPQFIRRIPLSLLLLMLFGAGAAACHRHAVTPSIGLGPFNQLSESQLANLLICNDTLGRSVIRADAERVARCTVCLPMGMDSAFESLRSHARKLWTQAGRTPYDSGGIAGKCIGLAYRRAQALRPNDDSLFVERSLFQLAALHDSVRVATLRALDSAIVSKDARRDGAGASEFLGLLSLGLWDRAQRQLERPVEVPLVNSEVRLHRLAEVAPRLTALPSMPPISRTYGESEAMWAGRLFDAAAQRATSASDRARWRRLSLTPWVVLERWASLDSAARAMLQSAPRDSAVLPALALAAYKRIAQPVRESPIANALFDSVVRALPRVDSARYDAFDNLLSESDDDWRYQFLPDQRRAMDVRGWSLIDPLWSTPVNEILLARRARVAEADYRYADVARPGEAGSETRAGAMLVRRGTPEMRWRPWGRFVDGKRWLQRGWPGLTAVVGLSDLPLAMVGFLAPSLWQVFYGSSFNGARLPSFPLAPDVGCVTSERVYLPTMYECAINQPAWWDSVPFVRGTTDIDVTVARFRASGDSADMYVGARLPLARFKAREDRDADPSDRIRFDLWLTNALGVPVLHVDSTRALPERRTLAWTQQWRHRVGSPLLMHRVEALEAGRPSGARGVAKFTSDAQVAFALRGFGMSDVLVAASATGTNAKRWSALAIQPNGAAVARAERFALIWEMYDLVPDKNGRVRWRVRLRRERGAVVSRNEIPRALTGSNSAGTRVVASESDAPDISYERDAVAATAVLDQLVFSLGDAAVGRHVVNVTIGDLVSGKSVTRGVSVRVYASADERRR